MERDNAINIDVSDSVPPDHTDNNRSRNNSESSIESGASHDGSDESKRALSESYTENDTSKSDPTAVESRNALSENECEQSPNVESNTESHMRNHTGEKVNIPKVAILKL